jgi:hypothetical protein
VRLSGNRLGDAGAKLVAASPFLCGLWWLDLSSNDIGEDGAEALVASPHLVELGTLVFYDNRDRLCERSNRDGEGAGVPPLGQALERKHGHRGFLHLADPGGDDRLSPRRGRLPDR